MYVYTCASGRVYVYVSTYEYVRSMYLCVLEFYVRIRVCGSSVCESVCTLYVYEYLSGCKCLCVVYV